MQGDVNNLKIYLVYITRVTRKEPENIHFLSGQI